MHSICFNKLTTRNFPSTSVVFHPRNKAKSSTTSQRLRHKPVPNCAKDLSRHASRERTNTIETNTEVPNQAATGRTNRSHKTEPHKHRLPDPLVCSLGMAQRARDPTLHHSRRTQATRQSRPPTQQPHPRPTQRPQPKRPPRPEPDSRSTPSPTPPHLPQTHNARINRILQPSHRQLPTGRTGPNRTTTILRSPHKPNSSAHDYHQAHDHTCFASSQAHKTELNDVTAVG